MFSMMPPPRSVFWEKQTSSEYMQATISYMQVNKELEDAPSIQKI